MVNLFTYKYECKNTSFFQSSGYIRRFLLLLPERIGHIIMNRWIRRKRNSHGYGVQSPNDFFFVQHVLREQSPYYAYAELHKIYQAVKASLPHVPFSSEEVYRLLFRLADYVHPEVLVAVGDESELAACSMTMARPAKRCVSICAKETESLPIPTSFEVKKGDEMAIFGEELQCLGTVELLYIAHTPHYKELTQLALSRVCNKTMFIIDGIRENREKRLWWQSLQESPLTGVSYALGTEGLLLFDKTRYKDAYWINIKKKRFFGEYEKE